MVDEQKKRRGRPRKETIAAIPTHAKWLPDNPDEPPFTEEDNRAFARQVISLYRITAKKSRDRIAAAIQDGEKVESLTPGEHILRDQIATVYFLNPEMRDEIKGVLEIDPDKVSGYIRQTLLDMGGEEQYLTGLEPPEDQQIAEIARRVEQDYLRIPRNALRGSSKIDRLATFIPNTGDDTIPLELNKKAEYEIKWNVLPTKTGEMQMVTPYDQEVEMALSNFVDRCFSTKPTPRDGATPTEQTYCYAATLEQIYSMMNGTKPGTKVHPTALEALKKSIAKLNGTDIQITEKRDGNIENIVSGRIIDAIELKQIRIHTGHIKQGFAFSRPGLLYMFEKHKKHLLTVSNDQLNISNGYWKKGELEAGKGAISRKKPTDTGWEFVKPSITPLSIVIRRYLIMEIFRIRNMGTNDTKGNKITYDALIKYEASPDLVEYGADGLPRTVEGHPDERILKQWITPAEKKSIENARAHRRKLVLDILGHLVATGLIKAYRETTEGRKKTGVIILVDKTQKALNEIKRKSDLKQYQSRKHGKK